MASDLVMVDADGVITEALTWPERATTLTVTDNATYTLAGELLLGIKDLRKRIVETFGPHVKRAFEAHRALVAEQRTAETPLAEAERIIKDRLRNYDDEQERIRRAEARRLEELVRKQEEDRRLAEALDAEAHGETAEVEAILSAPVPPLVIQVQKATPKVEGISYRETWSAEVVGLSALVAHVATHPEHLNLVLANTTALNGLARSLKGAMTIPGVRAMMTRDVAAGRR